MSALIALSFTALVLWFAFNRPGLRTGGWNGQRVYLRRGPGLGGIALAVIAFVYMSDHTGDAMTLLVLIIAACAALAVTFAFARRAINRNK